MIDDIVLKFKELPLEVQDKLSSIEILGILDKIEKQYSQRQVSLAEILMRIAIKEIDINNLTEILEKEYLLEREKAREISIALKEKISWLALGFDIEKKELLEEKAESKYFQLPGKIRNVIFAPENTEIFNQLAEKYNFDINAIVIRLVVGDITFNDLDKILVTDYHLLVSALRDVEENLSKILKPIIQMLEMQKPGEINTEELDREIEKLKENIPTLAAKLDINQAADNAITKVGLTFPDETIEKRFKNVVISFLREVRGEIETRIVLKRPQKIGGVELDEKIVDKVMDILKQEKPMIKIEPMGNIPQIELAEGLKQPEETIQKFTRMEKPEIKSVSLLSKIEEEKLLPQPEEVKEKLLKEKFEQEPLVAPILEKPAPVIEKPKPIIPEIKIVKEEPKLAMPEFKPIIPPVLEKKIEEKTAPNLFTAVSEEPKTKVSGPEEITDVLKEIDQLPPGDTPFVLDEEAEDKFKLPVRELPKEELKPIIEEPKVEEIKKEIKPQPQAEIFIHRPPREPAMAKMEEIKVTPRVSGPIEELQGATLQDFRRWGSAEQAVQKIKEKIDLLGEESLVKKSEGIKAWKESEINKLYLDIGTESIDKGISVSEVIILRQKENRKTLNEEEFDKVVELNQNLRF
ncbi:MAG: hypothetical protein PHE59_03205 [Patescibacteria group bacterium]|nr:hypothetical protein [Patescibacteria group bacterium]MDD5164332.1 hypothetical protein [Patescibacteria group bacterium]MDD5534300.1 hypothetical protein [Patescibacteria group bacterium]